MKLNLGCNDKKLEGFLNVDIRYQEGVDLVADIRSLTYENEIDEIYASHVIEHFPHTETLKILGNWHKALKTGGVLWLATPDFDKVVSIYNKTKMLTEWMMKFMYGDQGYKEAFHYTIFTYPIMLNLLNSVGFRNIDRIDGMPYSGIDCSNIKFFLTGDKVSLDIKAVK